MRLSAELSQSEIKEAIRDYVEKKTKGKVVENGITVHYSKAMDSRETDHMSATVKYEGA